MNCARLELSCLAVLACGGRLASDSSTTDACEVFSPIDLTWTQVQSLPEPRQGHQMNTIYNGQGIILVIFHLLMIHCSKPVTSLLALDLVEEQFLLLCKCISQDLLIARLRHLMRPCGIDNL